MGKGKDNVDDEEEVDESGRWRCQSVINDINDWDEDKVKRWKWDVETARDDDDEEEEAEGLLASLVLARPHLEQGQGRWYVASLPIWSLLWYFEGTLWCL